MKMKISKKAFAGAVLAGGIACMLSLAMGGELQASSFQDAPSAPVYACLLYTSS